MVYVNKTFIQRKELNRINKTSRLSASARQTIAEIMSDNKYCVNISYKHNSLQIWPSKIETKFNLYN